MTPEPTNAPAINLANAFLPGRRSDPDSFLIALGLVGLADGVRLSLIEGPAGPYGFTIVILLVVAVFINRLRGAGRRELIAVLPLGVALAVKAAAATIFISAAAEPYMSAYLAERGVDLTDPDALSVLREPGFNDGFRSFVEARPGAQEEIVTAGRWPSAIAWWSVLIAFGLWVARMRTLR